MVLMSDVGLIAIMLAAFLLAIGLVRLLGRLINPGAPNGWADDPPDTSEASPADAASRTSAGPASPDRAGRGDRPRDRGAVRRGRPSRAAPGEGEEPARRRAAGARDRAPGGAPGLRETRPAADGQDPGHVRGRDRQRDHDD
jgi:hypothetical protein